MLTHNSAVAANVKSQPEPAAGEAGDIIEYNLYCLFSDYSYD